MIYYEIKEKWLDKESEIKIKSLQQEIEEIQQKRKIKRLKIQANNARTITEVWLEQIEDLNDLKYKNEEVGRYMMKDINTLKNILYGIHIQKNKENM